MNRPQNMTEHDLHAAVVERSPSARRTAASASHFCELELAAAIELVVGPADEAVQILHRVLRQLIGIGQGQVGAGGPVEARRSATAVRRRQLSCRRRRLAVWSQGVPALASCGGGVREDRRLSWLRLAPASKARCRPSVLAAAAWQEHSGRRERVGWLRPCGRTDWSRQTRPGLRRAVARPGCGRR